MRKQIMRLVYLGVLAVMACQAIHGQSERDAAVAAAGDKYVISAKAGGVNYVEGSVSIVRKDGTGGYLTRRDEIGIGDVVTTGDNSKAEILLNPGSFLRIGSNSSFQFKTTSLDDLRIQLESGSAIFEVFASRDFKVRVTTPKAKMLLILSGVYRVDVGKDGGANVEVWEGDVLLGDRNATVVSSGRSAVLSGGVATVQKFDRGNKDEFELWSRARGKELAKQSAKLRDKALRNSLLTSFNSGRWGMYGSFGLWVYNPLYGGFCFLPFGNGWNSPYGFGYGNCMCYYNMPYTIYTPPNHGGGGGSGGGSSNPTITAIATSGDRSPTPPFVRMQGTQGSRGIMDTLGPNNNSTDRSSSSPIIIYTPPPSVPVSTDRAPSTDRVHH